MQKKRIPLRLIARESAKARERDKFGKEELRQMKILSTDIPFKSIMYIWNNKVAMITLREELMVVVVESKDVADLWRAMFEWVWGNTKLHEDTLRG